MEKEGKEKMNYELWKWRQSQEKKNGKRQN